MVRMSTALFKRKGLVALELKTKNSESMMKSNYNRFVVFENNFYDKNKPSAKRKMKVGGTFATFVLCYLVLFECLCKVSSTQSISMRLSIPYTVLLFDIVGISQGYITRSIRSAYTQSDITDLNIERLSNSAHSQEIPPAKNILPDQAAYQPPFTPPVTSATACPTIIETRDCTSEKEVCLLSNYSKFQLPNKGAQTIVSIGKSNLNNQFLFSYINVAFELIILFISSYTLIVILERLCISLGHNAYHLHHPTY